MPATESEIPEQQEKKLLEIFREKLVQYIHPTAVGRFCTTSLQEKDQEEVKRKEETAGKQAAAELLLDKLLQQDTQGWFSEFVEGLRRSGSKHVAEDLCPTETTPPADSSPYRELLRIVAPNLTQNMIPGDLLPYLSCLRQEDKEQIRQAQTTSGNIRAADVLLENIVRCGPGWFEDLCQALKETDDGKSLEMLLGERATDHDPVNDDLSSLFRGLSISESSASDGSVQPADASAMKAAMLDDPNLDEGYEEEAEDDGKCEGRGGGAQGAEGNFKMRNYQLELAEEALTGRNVVICSPTNSGKTRVAVFICKNHLEKNSNGKVLVMVNKVHLVEQHFQKQFKPLLPESFHSRMGTISGENYSAGEEHISFKQLVEQKNLIILTAQILENHLNRTDEERVELSDFSLIIFDECHHTKKEDVYNKIMGRVILQKHDHPDRPRPQIVGFTASPGVGGAKTHAKAVSHILQILANLDAAKIKTTEKHEDELKTVVGQPRRESRITNERLQDPFGDELKKMMQVIHQMTDTEGTGRPPADFGTQMYEQWVVEMEKQGGMRCNRCLQTCAEHLRKYNDALVINDTLRMSDAFQYLKDFYTEESDRHEAFDETDNKLSQLFSSHLIHLEKLTKRSQFENPNLEELKKKLKQECESKKDARGILYTKTRQSTVFLLSWIRNTPELNSILRADHLTGTGTGSNNKHNHMTSIKQREVIRQFREGELNLLIATTVAEEGLDIEKCNFVIRYGLVTNEIAMMQASGRARAEGSTYTLVAGGKSGAGPREENNLYKVEMMHRAIEHIQNMPVDQYEQEIKKRQREIYREQRFRRNPKIKERKLAAASGTFLHCKKCNQKACDAAELRLIEGAHHVHPDPEFLRAAGKADAADEPLQKFQDWSRIGSVKCRKCQQDWGMLMLHKGMNLPCLSIKNFTLRKQGLPPRRHKKWKDSGIAVADFDYAEDIETGDEGMDISDDEL